MVNRKQEIKGERKGSIIVTVADAGGDGAALSRAWVSLYQAPKLTGNNKFIGAKWDPDEARWLASDRTDEEGAVTFFNLEPDAYVIKYEHYPETDAQLVDVAPGCTESVCFRLPLNVAVQTNFVGREGQQISAPIPKVGDQLEAHVSFNDSDALDKHVELRWPKGMRKTAGSKFGSTTPLRASGPQEFDGQLLFGVISPRSDRPGGSEPAILTTRVETEVQEPVPSVVGGNINVSLSRTETAPTDDLRLWGEIRASTDSLSFNRYSQFMDSLFCPDDGVDLHSAERSAYDQLLKRRFLPFTDTDAYRVLKVATEAFVMVNCGVLTGHHARAGSVDVLADFESYLDRRDLPSLPPDRSGAAFQANQMLPYLQIIRRKLPDVPINGGTSPANFGELNGNGGGTGFADADLCEGFVREKLKNPCLVELIWSYWHEEGMQVQTMNAITRRFQNLRGSVQPDPLVNVEVNPLRPLNNLLWGYIQDEQHRLTVARRSSEYDHHYGLRLEGRAVKGFRPADSRSKFIEAFHHLLRLCTVFYKQDDNTTVKADAFGVLNALKEVHLILSQGAHSQFGDLPPTARIEMLIQQWLLSRAEFREFLPTRVMVAYQEPWMDRVDAMKKLQGWTDTSVSHFHNLAVFGEQILLAIRYGAWSTEFEPTQAFNFARFWRPQVLGYIHAYRAATGVELGAETVDAKVDATTPSVLLQQRLAAQQRSR